MAYPAGRVHLINGPSEMDLMFSLFDKRRTAEFTVAVYPSGDRADQASFTQGVNVYVSGLERPQSEGEGWKVKTVWKDGFETWLTFNPKSRLGFIPEEDLAVKDSLIKAADGVILGRVDISNSLPTLKPQS